MTIELYKEVPRLAETPLHDEGQALKTIATLLADRTGPFIINAAFEPNNNDDQNNTGGRGTFHRHSLVLTASGKVFYCLNASTGAAVWVELTLPASVVSHLSDTDNPHSTTKTHVGLGNVPDLDTTDAVNNQHTQGTDTLLASGGANEVTAADLRGHLDDADIHREINDAGSAATDLWSAEKIGSEITDAVVDPGGADTQLQFNDGGSFGGIPGMTYDKNTDTLATGSHIVLNDTASNLASVVPAQGQWAFATDTGKIVMGDGSTTFASLDDNRFSPSRHQTVGLSSISDDPIITSGFKEIYVGVLASIVQTVSALLPAPNVLGQYVMIELFADTAATATVNLDSAVRLKKLDGTSPAVAQKITVSNLGSAYTVLQRLGNSSTTWVELMTVGTHSGTTPVRWEDI